MQSLSLAIGIERRVPGTAAALSGKRRIGGTGEPAPEERAFASGYRRKSRACGLMGAMERCSRLGQSCIP